MKYRLGKNQMIKKRGEISLVFEKGIRAWDSRITLIALRRNCAEERSRLAVTVSKKHGNAVQRNKIKRTCREAFRLTQHELQAGWDYIILPRVGRDLRMQEICDSLIKLFGKIITKAQANENVE